MVKTRKKYDRPIEVADGIFWVGFRDEASNLSCNPYLIVEGEEAVLIDSGSRTDFAVVMMKILQTGVDPRQIVALIYQHYDPDLCGSMANFIDMCDNPKLKVISEDRNNVFISFYIPRKRYPLIHSIAKDRYTFSLGGRTLSFVLTPYAHSPGSFVTYDLKSRTVFSSDLFGSYAATWDLFLSFTEECYTCENYEECPNLFTACPVKDILAFHKEIMPCKTALRHALKVIRQFCLERIAPQHGSILSGDRDISYILKKLERLEKVGIDAIV